jgi:integrase
MGQRRWRTVRSVRGRSRPTLLPCARLSTIAGGAAWTRSFHTRRFAAAVAAAGLDPEATFYALRHSYISRALKAGVPVKAVADHCGTSLAMIARHYSKFLAEDRRRYAALAAPPLRLELAGDEASPLRVGGSRWERSAPATLWRSCARSFRTWTA